MKLASGTAPTAVALRSYLQGYVPRSALLGGCSSEPPPRCALRPSLYLGTCSFERFPKRLLLGGTTAGHAHECLPKWALFGGTITGLAHGYLPKRLLLGGTTVEVALLENSSWYGSSEPLPEEPSLSILPGALFIGALPLAAALRSLHRGFCSTEVFPWQLLLGGTNKGLPHRALPKAAPPRRNHSGSRSRVSPPMGPLRRNHRGSRSRMSPKTAPPRRDHGGSHPPKNSQGWLLGAIYGCLFTGPSPRSLSLKRLPCGGSSEPLFWVSLLERSTGDLLGGTTGASLQEVSSRCGSSEPSLEGLSAGIFHGPGPLNRGVWEKLGRHDQISEDLPGGL